MKSKVFLPLILVMIWSSSCKKTTSEDPKPTTETPSNTPKTTISTSDPKTLSQSIELPAGSKIAGNPPSASSDLEAPKISQSDSTINAISGRYININPNVSKGEIAGYYFKIEGSDTYFKVPVTSNSSNLRLFESGTSDNLVLKLPENIAAGTFCANYCVYDKNNRVSNVVKVCVEVSALGGEGAEFLSSGSGKWTVRGFTEDGVYKAVTFPYISKDTSYVRYSCFNNGVSSLDSFQTYHSFQLDKYSLEFASNSASKLTYIGSYSRNNYIYPTLPNPIPTNYCHKPTVSDSTVSENYSFSGGWSFDKATNRIVLVFDFKEYGDGNPEGIEGKILSKSDSKFTIESKNPDGTVETIDFVKQ